MAEQEGDATFSFVALEPLQQVKVEQLPLFHHDSSGINMKTSEAVLIKDMDGMSETLHMNSRGAAMISEDNSMHILKGPKIEVEQMESLIITSTR